MSKSNDSSNEFVEEFACPAGSWAFATAMLFVSTLLLIFCDEVTLTRFHVLVSDEVKISIDTLTLGLKPSL